MAKKRAQRLAAEALDQQLREKGALRAEGRPSTRPHLLQPTASAPATVHRAGPPSVQSDGSEADAGPEKHEWSHIQRRSRSDVMVDELADRSDGQAWWHQVPPNEYLPRRRGGNELMRSPEEARAREAERRKKLVVGEALRGQMREREATRRTRPDQRLSRSSPELQLRGLGADREEHGSVDARRAKRAELRGTWTPWGLASQFDDIESIGDNTAPAPVSWAEHFTLQQKYTQLERRLTEFSQQAASAVHSVASPTPSSEPHQLQATALELKRAMATMQDDNALLNADLDDQIDLIVQLDDRQAMLAAQVERLIGGGVVDLSRPQHHDINVDAGALNAVLASVAGVEARMAATVEELRRQIMQQHEQQLHSPHSGTIVAAAAAEKQQPYEQRMDSNPSDAAALVAALRAELDSLRSAQAVDQRRLISELEEKERQIAHQAERRIEAMRIATDEVHAQQRAVQSSAGGGQSGSEELPALEAKYTALIAVQTQQTQEAVEALAAEREARRLFEEQAAAQLAAAVGATKAAQQAALDVAAALAAAGNAAQQPAVTRDHNTNALCDPIAPPSKLETGPDVETTTELEAVPEALLPEPEPEASDAIFTAARARAKAKAATARNVLLEQKSELALEPEAEECAPIQLVANDTSHQEHAAEHKVDPERVAAATRAELEEDKALMKNQVEEEVKENHPAENDRQEPTSAVEISEQRRRPAVDMHAVARAKAVAKSKNSRMQASLSPRIARGIAVSLEAERAQLESKVSLTDAETARLEELRDELKQCATTCDIAGATNSVAATLVGWENGRKIERLRLRRPKNGAGFGISLGAGCVVNAARGVAERNGIERGDVLRGVNHLAVSEPEEVWEQLSVVEPGSVVDLDVLRNTTRSDHMADPQPEAQSQPQSIWDPEDPPVLVESVPPKRKPQKKKKSVRIVAVKKSTAGSVSTDESIADVAEPRPESQSRPPPVLDPEHQPGLVESVPPKKPQTKKKSVSVVAVKKSAVGSGSTDEAAIAAAAKARAKSKVAKAKAAKATAAKAKAADANIANATTNGEVHD